MSWRFFSWVSELTNLVMTMGDCLVVRIPVTRSNDSTPDAEAQIPNLPALVLPVTTRCLSHTGWVYGWPASALSYSVICYWRLHAWKYNRGVHIYAGDTHVCVPCIWWLITLFSFCGRRTPFEMVRYPHVTNGFSPNVSLSWLHSTLVGNLAILEFAQ